MAGTHRVAVLIACKNGAETIANSVRSAVEQADVFVVSDGSDDARPRSQRAAGAPCSNATSAAESRTRFAPGISPSSSRARTTTSRFSTTTRLSSRATSRSSPRRWTPTETIAAASGRIDSVWDHARRWNPLIAMRAFMYWSYQTTIKRGQNALRVVNVICGANTAFRAEVFEQLINEDAPYAIDDMYWLAEIVRRKLGRVEFVHDARSWTIDPHRFGDWYKQTVRWSWGQFQSVRGHRLGAPLQRDSGRRRGWAFSWFDAAYLALLLDWFAVRRRAARWSCRLRGCSDAGSTRSGSSPSTSARASPGSGSRRARCGSRASSCSRPRSSPSISCTALTMLHAVIKTIYRPRIEICKWDSPERFQTAEPTGRRTLLERKKSNEGTHHRRSRLHRIPPRGACCSKDGDEVYVLDDLSTGSLDNVAHLRGDPRFHLVVDSVLHPAVVNELVNKVRRRLPPRSRGRSQDDRRAAGPDARVNLEGTETVLDACCKIRQAGARRLDVRGVRRPPERGRRSRETSRRIYGATTQKRWAYADSKAMDEFLALAYHEEHGLDAVIVRLFNTVGPAPDRHVRHGHPALRRARTRAATRSRSTATASRPDASATSRTRSGRSAT